VDGWKGRGGVLFVVRGFLGGEVLRGVQGDDRGGSVRLDEVLVVVVVFVCARDILFPSLSVRSDGGCTSDEGRKDG
jgi:hypothetical protein